MRLLIFSTLLLLPLSNPQALLAQGFPQDTARQDTAAHKFVPYTEPPRLLSPREARTIVARHYPEELKEAGVGGQVRVYVFVQVDGRVGNALVDESSGNELLDQAALSAVREFRFKPARLREKTVPVWVLIPISFDPERWHSRAA